MDKEKNIVGKNLLEGTYFDGNGIPKMIGITKAEYLEYKQLQQENKQLKDNWNELKKYAKKIISTDNELYGTDLLNKMQELQENSNKLGRICKIMLGNIPKRIYITKDQYLEYKQLQQESKQLKERIEYLERKIKRNNKNN